MFMGKGKICPTEELLSGAVLEWAMGLINIH
jgi:hypothetical protein